MKNGELDISQLLRVEEPCKNPVLGSFDLRDVSSTCALEHMATTADLLVTLLLPFHYLCIVPLIWHDMMQDVIFALWPICQVVAW